MFHNLSTLSRLLLNLSGRARLISVTLIFVCCTILLLVFNLPSPDDDSLFVIPVALAAWLFTRNGAIITFTASISIIAVANTFTSNGILWSDHLTHTFIGGIVALSIVILVVLFMRYNLDITDTAMKKARQVEEQVEIAFEQQRALNQLKDQFIITVNHELRTPLTEVHGYLDLLQEYSDTLQPDLRATFLQKAIHGCEELQVMVNTILDAMQAGNLENIPKKLKPLSVVRLIEEVLESFAPQHMAQYHIQVDIPVHLQIVADAQYVRQIVRNYLSNAFKYAPKHTSIAISATLHTDENAEEETPSASRVVICVKDAGPGIPADDLPSLFSKFFRLERDHSGPIRGTGLGLFVCKQIAEAMGGSVWAKSEGIPGKGSSFYLSLPGTSDPITDGQPARPVAATTVRTHVEG